MISVCRWSFVPAALLASSRLLAQAPPVAAATPLDVRTLSIQALSANPSARAAQQKLVEAQARLAEAGAQRRFQPTFAGSVSGAYGQVAQPVSTQLFGTVEGILTFPFPNNGKLSALQTQALAQVRAAQAALDRARLDLAFRANDVYYQVLRTRGARDIAQDTLTQAERQVQDTQKRVDAGDLAPAEVLKAQVPAAQARVTVSRAQNAVRVAEQTLNSLILRDLSVPVEVAPAPALPTLTLTREQAGAQALERSPDVREAQANLDAAQAALRSVRHDHDPDYSLQASHIRTSDITAYSNLTTLMFNITIPLGVGGIAREQEKQAQAQIEQSRSALALAKQQAELAAEQAFLDVETDQANTTATQETVRIAQESLDKARLAFQAGLTTTRDVLDAQLALAQARNEANAAVYDLAVARAKLDQVIEKEPAP